MNFIKKHFKLFFILGVVFSISTLFSRNFGDMSFPKKMTQEEVLEIGDKIVKELGLPSGYSRTVSHEFDSEIKVAEIIFSVLPKEMKRFVRIGNFDSQSYRIKYIEDQEKRFDVKISLDGELLSFICHSPSTITNLKFSATEGGNVDLLKMRDNIEDLMVRIGIPKGRYSYEKYSQEGGVISLAFLREDGARRVVFELSTNGKVLKVEDTHFGTDVLHNFLTSISAGQAPDFELGLAAKFLVAFVVLIGACMALLLIFSFFASTFWSFKWLFNQEIRAKNILTFVLFFYFIATFFDYVFEISPSTMEVGSGWHIYKNISPFMDSSSKYDFNFLILLAFLFKFINFGFLDKLERLAYEGRETVYDIFSPKTLSSSHFIQMLCFLLMVAGITQFFCSSFLVFLPYFIINGGGIYEFSPLVVKVFLSSLFLGYNSLGVSYIINIIVLQFKNSRKGFGNFLIAIFGSFYLLLIALSFYFHMGAGLFLLSGLFIHVSLCYYFGTLYLFIYSYFANVMYLLFIFYYMGATAAVSISIFSLLLIPFALHYVAKLLIRSEEGSKE